MSKTIRDRFGVWASMVLCASASVLAAGPDLRLVTAAAEQDKAAVRALLKERVNVNSARGDGSTALLWAAHWNDLEMVDLLLRAGAQVNAPDDHGVTPLARGAENGDLAMTERLLTAKANANAAETSGRTPLMIAAKTGNVQVVKALLVHGANVNATTADGNTALMWAIAERHDDLARVLVEGQADVRATSTRGFTPLMFAARNGDIEMARTLMAAGARVNDTTPDGTHLLPFAIVSGQVDFAMFLLEQGADANGSMGGMKALHTAAGSSDLWLTEWYRQHGLGGGYAAVGSARVDAARRAQLVRALLARGADVNSRATTSAMQMTYIAYPTKGAFESFACGTGDLLGATPLWVAANAASGNQLQLMEVMGAPRTEGYGEVVRALLQKGRNAH